MSGLGPGAIAALVVLISMTMAVFFTGLRRPFMIKMALRSLARHVKMNIALLLAACVSTTVISGALIAGDSLGESITSAVIENLGEVDEVVSAAGLLNASVAMRLAQNTTLMRSVDHISPLIYLGGIAENPGTNARTRTANIIGIQGDFLEFGDLVLQNGKKMAYELEEDEVLVNQALASEIGVKAGELLYLSFSDPSSVFEAIFLGGDRVNEVTAMLRVKEIVRAESLGRFQLNANRNPPQNVYVPLSTLNILMKGKNSINMILVSNTGDEKRGALLCDEVAATLKDALGDALLYEDAGLSLAKNEKMGCIKLEAKDVFFSYDYFKAIESATIPARNASSPQLTYFFNTLTYEDRMVPYSTVTAFDPSLDSRFGMFVLNGTKEEIAGFLGDSEIMINSWAAERLGVSVGDLIAMNYSVMDEFYGLDYLSRNFTVKYIADMEGKANDSALMPGFPGIEGIENPIEWDPPFPIDLSLIKEEDEAYWDAYRGTPKAFVSLKVANELWRTDIGNITQIKMLPKDRFGLDALQNELADVLNEKVGMREAKVIVKTIKQDSLKAREGTALFTEMFLAFCAACIIASCTLIALIATLTIESRMIECGILRALGFRKGALGSMFLIEGAAIGFLGGFLGILGGLAFGSFLIGGLNSFWSSAVEGSSVSFHYTADSLALGFCLGVIISVLTMDLAFRIASRRTVVGAMKKIIPKDRKRRDPAIPLIPLILGALMLAFFIASGFSFSGELALLSLALGVPMILISLGMVAARLGRKHAFLWLGLAFIAYTLLLMLLFKDRLALIALFFTSGFLLLFGFLLIFYHVLTRDDAQSLSHGFGGLRKEGGTWQFAFARRNAARARWRSMLTVFMFSLTLFVLVSLTINLQGAVLDMDRAIMESGGGFQIMGESSHPVYADLMDAPSRRESQIQGDVFNELEIQQFKVRGDVGGTCSNLNPHARPRIIGVNESFYGTNSFVFVSHDEPENKDQNPWSLLSSGSYQNEIPAVGDYNTVVWILGLELGSRISMLDEKGEVVFLRIVGIIGNSIFPGSFLIWDGNFELMYPTHNGFNLFLFKSRSEALKPQILALESSLSRFGFDAFTVESQVAENIAIENTYISIFQVILAFALIIGTLGFGIVSFRNVLERRREIGIMRAMGFTSRAVFKSLLYENSFIAVGGIAIGTIAGITASSVYFLKLHLDPASLPWLHVIAIIAVSFAIAISSTFVPIYNSSRMSVAEALRAYE